MRKRCCCSNCDPVHVSLSEDGLNLGPSWEVGDVVNVIVHGVDEVTVNNDTIRVVRQKKADDSVSGSFVASISSITTTGSGTYKGNNTIKFSGHANEYRVLRHNGTSLEISPGLSSPVADGETITDVTPKAKFVSVEAYSVRVDFQGTNNRIRIHQGADSAPYDNSLNINLASRTIDFNSEPQEEVAYPVDGAWHYAHLYVCPTHRMGEASIQFDPFEPGVPAQYQDLTPRFFYYGTALVDDDPYTVNNAWSIEAVGQVRLTKAIWSPAQVKYSGSTKVVDCGRHDLFACPWMIWKDFQSQSLDLTVSGWDHPLPACSSPCIQVDHIWALFNSTLPLNDPAPGDSWGMSNLCAFYTSRGHKQQREVNQDTEWSVQVREFVNPFNPIAQEMTGGIAYTRAIPTAATPYPKPSSVASLSYEINLTGTRSLGTTSLTIGDARDITDPFVIEATMPQRGIMTGDSTLRWSFP